MHNIKGKTMKKTMLALLLLLVAGLQSVMAQKHKWVDLGLPSGTFWATCNVGANSPEEYGDYFAWGETTPKSTYDWSVYKFCNSSQDLITKYCSESDYGDDGFTDKLTKLLPEDDAATVNWGSEWQTPSNEQYQELINRNYTTTTWTMQNGVYGRKITSKSNGNCIFLPAAGCYYDVGLYFVGIYGYYWSRSLEKSFCIYSNYLYFNSDYAYTHSYRRNNGLPVRPVRTK